jgi:predicted Zn finger-like uncharacterized protein
MIIACPNCKTKYNLPDSKIPAGGAKVKCSKCAHVFKAAPPRTEPEDQALDLLENPAAKAPQGSSQAFEEAFDEAVGQAKPAPKPAPKPTPRPKPAPEPEPEPEPEEEAQAEEESFGEQAPAEDEAPAEEEIPDEEDEGPGLDMDLGASPAREKMRKKPPVVALLLVVLLLILVYGAYLLQPVLPFKLPALPFSLPGVKAPVAAEKAAESPANRVKKIALLNVRQYVAPNEKAGPIFVIEGKAMNTFDTPKERIRVEGALYDEHGNVLASKQILCGNTLSHLQLQVQTEEEINAGLASEVGVLSNNTFLKPGMDTPFMIVFFNPPKNVKEFGVKVVDALDPAQ